MLRNLLLVAFLVTVFQIAHTQEVNRTLHQIYPTAFLGTYEYDIFTGYGIGTTHAFVSDQGFVWGFKANYYQTNADNYLQLMYKTAQYLTDSKLAWYVGLDGGAMFYNYHYYKRYDHITNEYIEDKKIKAKPAFELYLGFDRLVSTKGAIFIKSGYLFLMNRTGAMTLSIGYSFFK